MELNLEINDVNIPMNPFMKELLAKLIKTYTGSLKGVKEEEIETIDLSIKF